MDFDFFPVIKYQHKIFSVYSRYPCLNIFCYEGSAALRQSMTISKVHDASSCEITDILNKIYYNCSTDFKFKNKTKHSKPTGHTF